MNTDTVQPDANGSVPPDPQVQLRVLRERLLELLAAEQTGSLAPDEIEELMSLRRRVPPITDATGKPVDDGSMDRTIGVLLAASVMAERGGASRLSAGEDAMSPAVRQRLLAVGQSLAVANGRVVSAAPAGRVRVEAERPGGRGLLIGPVGWIGWAAAAAAIVALVLAPRGPVIPVAPSASDRLAVLLADPDNTVRITWQAQADPAAKEVAGEVIWNGQLQEGFMRFKGLAENLPSKEQYQLWIFDAGRTDAAFPVDGGVFDITSAQRDAKTGDLLVPIRATLPVRKPAAFAVTIEQPGGVVVTKKERLLVLAPVKTGGG